MILSPKKILVGILVFAFLVRIFGIGYGLPLWVISDEPPFILGALKMMELKTVIPAFHDEEFKSVLYYPPYLSYALLPFYAGITGIKYLTFDGNREDFVNFIGADFSAFFIMARLLNILVGVLSVYLVYRTAKNLFKETSSGEWAALAAAFFVAFNLLHIMLSLAIRQWMAVSLVFILSLFFLTQRHWAFNKRYFYSILSTGIGMGVGVISAVALIFPALYFLFFENTKKIRDLLKNKSFYLWISMFIFLSLVPLILYPSSIGFGGKITATQEKSFRGLVSSPFIFLAPLLKAEPILMTAAAVGLLFAFFKNRKFFWLTVIFVWLYSIIFYWAFRFEDRFLLPLIPLIALSAGFGLKEFILDVKNFNPKISYTVLTILLLFTFAGSLKLGYLAYNDDSRKNAREWIENNLPEGTKVAVNVRLMRISSTKEAIQEQREIDPNSLRQADKSDEYFGRSPFYRSFHALNLEYVSSDVFMKNLEQYLKENSYEYLIAIQNTNDGAVSIADTHLPESPLSLFRTKELGPILSINKLR